MPHDHELFVSRGFADVEQLARAVERSGHIANGKIMDVQRVQDWQKAAAVIQRLGQSKGRLKNSGNFDFAPTVLRHDQRAKLLADFKLKLLSGC